MDAVQKRAIAGELHDRLVAYWHDVDFNWGYNAGEYYTDDAQFWSNASHSYNGRKEIEEFYAYRRDRGARVVVHAISNYLCNVDSDTSANADWICMIHAHDGDAPQATAPPINISLVKDDYVRRDGVWLVKNRLWKALFTGGAPATVLSREELDRRKAGSA